MVHEPSCGRQGGKKGGPFIAHEEFLYIADGRLLQLPQLPQSLATAAAVAEAHDDDQISSCSQQKPFLGSSHVQWEVARYALKVSAKAEQGHKASDIKHDHVCSAQCPQQKWRFDVDAKNRTTD